MKNVLIKNVTIRFIMILSEHLVRCDTDAVDFKSPWYQWTVGRLHQIFMLHHEQVRTFLPYTRAKFKKSIFNWSKLSL